MTWRYEDIVNMPHHVSKIRKPLSPESRAAQFAPFAALSAADSADDVRPKDELALWDYDISALSGRLAQVLAHIDDGLTLNIVYLRRTPEVYHQMEGRLKGYDVERQTLLFTDGTKIRVDDIVLLDTPDLAY